MVARRRDARELEILAVIAEALNRSADVSAALERTLELAAGLLTCESGWIWLRDERTRKFYLAASYNLPPFLREPVRMAGSKCWCIESLLEGELGSHNVDAIECSRLRPAVLRNQTALTSGIAYHASVAIRFGGRDLGLMNLTKPGLRKIERNDLRVLGTIADQLGIAVERARLAETATQLARMRERAELARDLHDTFAQDLTAITLQLEAALHHLERKGEPAQKIASALSVARESVTRARRSVEALRTAPDSGGPLDAALAGLARTFTSQTGVPVHLQVDAAATHPAVERAAYAICQEALTNVRRHAKAKNVWIEAARSRGTFVLTVRDDGKGVAPRQAGGFGITGMQERAQSIGGRLSVRRRPGGGTEVRARLPTAQAMRLRISVVDDHPIVRDGIVAVIGTQPDFSVVEASQSAAALTRDADAIVLDWELPQAHGASAVALLRERFPRAAIVIFSAYGGEERVRAALDAGARGYVLKGSPAEDLLGAIRGGIEGRTVFGSGVHAPFAHGERLTPRENDVLKLLALGHTNAQIAQRLRISERTVKFHVTSLFSRLGAKRRTEAVAIARERGML